MLPLGNSIEYATPGAQLVHGASPMLSVARMTSTCNRGSFCNPSALICPPVREYHHTASANKRPATSAEQGPDKSASVCAYGGARARIRNLPRPQFGNSSRTLRETWRGRRFRKRTRLGTFMLESRQAVIERATKENR